MIPARGLLSNRNPHLYAHNRIFLGSTLATAFKARVGRQCSSVGVQYSYARHFAKQCVFCSRPGAVARTWSSGSWNSDELPDCAGKTLSSPGMNWGKIFMTKTTKNHRAQKCPHLLQGVFCLFLFGLGFFSHCSFFLINSNAYLKLILRKANDLTLL